MERRSPVPAIVAPVGLGLFSLGLAFGLLVVHAGLAWWWATVFTVALHLWRRNALVSIVGGTLVNVLLVSLL